MTDKDSDPLEDPRRAQRVSLRWARDGSPHATLFIAGKILGAIVWSPKRGAWSIEDAFGTCLHHAAGSRSEALAVARQMVVDGLFPTPQQAQAERQARQAAQAERRARQPVVQASERATADETADMRSNAMDMTDSRTDEERLRNAKDAKATCSCCGKCGRKLAADAPVWRDRINLGWGPTIRRVPRSEATYAVGLSYTIAPVCKRCRSPVSVLFGPARPCENCARPVHQSRDRAGHVVCCDACADAVRLAAARQRRAEARTTRQCDICSETFEPTRTDARFCSSPCRQRAWRRRQTETETVTDDGTRTACP